MIGISWNHYKLLPAISYGSYHGIMGLFFCDGFFATVVFVHSLTILATFALSGIDIMPRSSRRESRGRLPAGLPVPSVTTSARVGGVIRFKSLWLHLAVTRVRISPTKVVVFEICDSRDVLVQVEMKHFLLAKVEDSKI